MATRIRYKCPTCESTVEMSTNVEGQLTIQASIPCPKLGCNDKALVIWTR